MKFYQDNQEIDLSENPNHILQVSVVDNDTFSVAARIQNPGCLSFASSNNPGGGYLSVIDTKMPIKTQEEDLFRRSNLPEIMDVPEVQKYYPLTGLKSIYCKAIVSKDTFLNEVPEFEAGIITMPALPDPRIQDYDLVRKKVERICQIAIENGHCNLILGAWGCGVFGNDPQRIASYFLEMLQKYQGYFSEVVFAIPNQHSENFQLFERQFR
jgi:uncharacterized protein (TIGR02452 family)